MPKKLFTAVAGLEPFAGVKPTGVQVRVKAQTGPFVPRFIDDDDSLILLLACRRSDVTLKHLDDQPVLRIDLDANEILEVTDREAGIELMRLERGNRDRAISHASGYDGTTTGPNGETVHTDADGTVLTEAEVAALRGVATGPTVDEAEAWWEEQQYLPGVAYTDVDEDALLDVLRNQGAAPIEVEYVGVLERTLISPRDDVLAAAAPVSAVLAEARAWWAQQTYHEGLGFGDVTEKEMVDLVGRIPLNEVEHVRVLDDELCWGEDGPRPVLEAVEARLADHADAVNAPGWSPLEAGLPIVEVRRRLATISDVRILADLLDAETRGGGRKRVRAAIDDRIAEVERAFVGDEDVPPLDGPEDGIGMPPLNADDLDSLQEPVIPGEGD